MKRLSLCLLLFFLAAGCRAFFWGQNGSHVSSKLSQAEELSRQGKYEQAIQAYQQHMQERLNYSGRPAWENPYFYWILIGDIQLGQGHVEEAIKSYQEADAQKVDAYLVSDRFRSVALWYEKQNQLAQALDFLSKYRSRDPILMDSMLDRLSKQLVQQEEQALPTPRPTPTAAARR